MNSDPEPQIGPWRRRILRAILPAGVLLLVLWIGWSALLLASDSTPGSWWGSAIIGFLTSILLIWGGYRERRRLSR